jgi:hypothetical protein
LWEQQAETTLDMDAAQQPLLPASEAHDTETAQPGKMPHS